MTSDLNVSHGKMYVSVSLTLVGFTLVTKMRNFDFENHWNTSIFFYPKKWYQIGMECVLSDSAWFGLSFVVWVEFCQLVEKYWF